MLITFFSSLNDFNIEIVTQNIKTKIKSKLCMSTVVFFRGGDKKIKMALEQGTPQRFKKLESNA